MRRQQDYQHLKFVIYARRSIERRTVDEVIESVEDQIDTMRDIAERDGLKIVETLWEDKSAAKPGARTAFPEMIALLRSRKANAILCWDYDRLARNPEEHGVIQQLIQDNYLELVKTPSTEYDEEAVFQIAFESAASSEYIRKLKRNIKRGQKGAAGRGFRPTLAPLGYKNTKYRDHRPEMCEIDPENFPLVRRIFDLVLSREYTPHEVFKMAIFEWGMRARKTKRNPTCKPLSIHSFYNILNNPFYYGEFRWPANDENAPWLKGNHTPMITKAEYDDVQRILKRKGTPRNWSYTHAYTGLMRCGGCGARITCEKKIKRQQNGNVHEYSYYRCSGQLVKGCKQKSVTLPKLEEVFVRFLSSIEIHPKLHEWAMTELKKEYDKETSDKDSILYKLERTSKSNEEKLSRLTDMRIAGDLTSEQFREKREPIELEQRGIKDQIENIDLRFKTWVEDADRLLTFAEKAREKFESGGQQERRAIIAALGTEHILDQGVLTFVVPTPIEVLTSSSELSYEALNLIEPPKSKEEYAQKGSFEPSCEMRWRCGESNSGPNPVFRASLRRVANVEVSAGE